MTQKLFSTADCIRLLSANGVQLPEHRLVYAYRSGKLAEPRFHVAGKRVYTCDDVRRIASFFGIDLRTLEIQGERHE